MYKPAIVLLCLAVVSSAYFIPDSKCLHCICLHESNCQPLACRMDVGSLSCGYYQIKTGYYSDAKQWDGWHPSDGYAMNYDWKTCSLDATCAQHTVYNYMERYARHSCTGSGAPNCETFARIHNGGPNGCNNPGTLAYWDAIKRCYEG